MSGRLTYGIGWALVPAPVTLEQTGDTLTLPCRGRIVLSDAADGTYVFARQLADDIAAATGLAWDIAAGNVWTADISLSLDNALEAEEYKLAITADGVRITGGSRAGVRNGVQTLRQIIRQCAPVLPCLHITDRPAFATRGYYLDITRGRVPTLAWLKEWAERLCLLKYNQLQLYVEHTMAFDGMADVWRGADPLSADDIMALDRHCADLGIELVPSVSTFGHQYTALRTKRLRNLGELPGDADRPFSYVERLEHHTLNATDPKALDFSKRLIDQTMALFRSHTFNICADETFDLGRGATAETAAKVGVPALYAGYVTRLCDHVAAAGRKPMMWADIAIQSPEILPQLPQDVLLLNWQYSPEADDSGVRLVAESGARQIVCPGVLGWNTLLGQTHNAWRNISRMARFGKRYGAEGILVADWGDYGHVNDPRIVMPAVAYGAACAWSADGGADPSGADDHAAEEAMNRAVSMAWYGDRTGTLVDAVSRLADDSWFNWDRLVRYVELDDGKGGVNLDVLGTLMWRPGSQREALEEAGRRGDLAAARASWVRAVAEQAEQTRPGTIAAADGRLGEAAERLGALMPTLDADVRAEIGQAFLVGLEGQRLLNRFGEIMLARAREDGAAETDAAAMTDTADAVDVTGAADTTDVADIMDTADSEDTKDIAAAMDVTAATALAEQLDEWFATYADPWRAVSRESELARIGSLIATSADLLR